MLPIGGMQLSHLEDEFSRNIAAVLGSQPPVGRAATERLACARVSAIRNVFPELPRADAERPVVRLAARSPAGQSACALPTAGPPLNGFD